ncbi:TIGR03943 family putative permease subunit [Aeribacillus composti]|uniref:TIGR03943 family putative permease subunit n=1 Tax=Aeribacillus composti TaxID=1868734 RepID=UPI002E2067E6|nr:TIGR03943 family protein [Aeribacillus composti]
MRSFHMFMRGIILAGYALLLFKLLLTSQLVNYVSPKMHPFIYFALFVLLILGGMQILRSGMNTSESHCHCDGEHHMPKTPASTVFIYSLFLLPVMIGLMLSNHVLDSSVASKRGVQFGAQPLAESSNSQVQTEEKDLVEEYLRDPEGYMKKVDERVNEILQEDDSAVQSTEKENERLKNDLIGTDKIVVTDEKYISTINMISENVEQLIGKKVEITGFVFRERDFRSNQLVVARFGVTCCIADASVYGMLVEGENVAKLKDDTWIKVTGTIHKTTYHQSTIPVIEQPAIEMIEVPDQPYVYEEY